MFQSLIGFKINWNPHYLNRKLAIRMFQSLIGFKINWNQLDGRELPTPQSRFNP
ncbi:unknown protein [Microcystis aeruginosa NIES-843]|uniref:Uncharacterized protein n=1 Tax=Microcystis aeruginosa (strain NIES-843 / IAM M-2473) TaxID=449447 RepID=B0JKY3_MICAN|nr:unknown protein [Microcystis aeruginosa NIES-843]